MKHEFKVGDHVRIHHRDKGNRTGILPGWSKPNGNAGQKGYITDDDGSKSRSLRVDVSMEKNSGQYVGWFSPEELELAAKKPTKEKPPMPTKFILLFEKRNEDFTSEKALRTRIAELAKEPVAGRTFTVYDIKRTRTVTLGVKITLK